MGLKMEDIKVGTLFVWFEPDIGRHDVYRIIDVDPNDMPFSSGYIIIIAQNLRSNYDDRWLLSNLIYSPNVELATPLMEALYEET